MQKHKPSLCRCAVYTRKSSEEGLEQDFNSLDAQREACEAFIQSQRHEGWQLISTCYDDGGFSGGTMERPALTRLLAAIENHEIDIVVVYKVDRLSRSLADFVRLVELFDHHKMSFVSVTQQFNTSTSMGRLTLNVLLSFAQFEREVTGERIRDKIAASKKKGLWMGGVVPLGYDVKDRQLVINQEEANLVRHIFARYQATGTVRQLKAELDGAGFTSKRRDTQGKMRGGKPFARGGLYCILRNPLYIGKISHKGIIYNGQHTGIVDSDLWQAAQALLDHGNRRRQHRTDAKEPSLLAGLIYDDRGNPMSPTHGTKKKNRRYRYYVSQAILQFREKEAGSVVRLPAATIEDLVVNRVTRLLSGNQELLDIVRPLRLCVDQQHMLLNQAESYVNDWNNWTPHHHIQQLKRFLRRVTVGQQEVTIILSPTDLLSTVFPELLTVRNKNALPDTLDFTLPVQLKRRGLEKRLILPTGDPSPPPQERIKRLRHSLARALTWHYALVTGEVQSLREIAQAEGIDPSNAARYLRMAYLAPDIIQAIIDGTVPSKCCYETLKQGVPMDWVEQRHLLGFAPISD